MKFNPQNVERLYAISTAHLPRDVLDELERFTLHPSSMVVLFQCEYGALLWIPEDDGGAWREALSLDEDRLFIPIIEWAQAHTLRWIKLDCDAPEIDDLPSFDHEQGESA